MLSSAAGPVSARPQGTVDERSLVQAFASFSEVAASLERSYSHLQKEVARLRRELEETNRDLGHSLEENRRMRHRLDRILEALPCGVLVLEEDGGVSVSNPEARRVLGLEAETGLPPWMRALLQHAPPEGAELEYHSNDGPSNCISMRRAQLGLGQGASMVCILEDITRLKRLQQEHEVLRRRQSLAEMSAVLAHEVRNPLASMELFAGLLAGSALNDECRRWVDHLQAGLRTLAATVNNVLQFHSQPTPGLAPTDLGQLLHSVVEFLAPLARQSGVRMSLVDQLDGVQIAADRHRLEQVLLNLALNAIRFMPDGGQLSVLGSVEPWAGSVRAMVRVKDSGPGIPRENRKRIFQPGFTTRPGSPGLGLAVCRTILEQHNASLAIESMPGQGTTFVLGFPLPGPGHAAEERAMYE